jgi:hypothetical protein
LDPDLLFDRGLLDAALDRDLLDGALDRDLLDAAFEPELACERDLGFERDRPVEREPDVPEFPASALPLASAARWRADLLALWAAAGVAGGLAFCAGSGLCAGGLGLRVAVTAVQTR